jgi:4'-phosphopantetheinyl transferase
MAPNTARAREVDVWSISCEPGKGIDSSAQLLSPDEQERAERFHRELDRIQFRLTHSAVRMILAQYLNVGPQELSFASGIGGKPELASHFRDTGIQFNLSHSSELALLAVAREAVVGADVEWINPEIAIGEIAERFFSAAEIQVLNALPADERVDAFFSCWTRKEAYIKALGEGLSVPLDSFEVAFGSQRAAALVAVRANPAELSRWSMYDLKVPKGYKGALVVEGTTHRIREFRWTPELVVEGKSQ